jgi:SAM-dependent methyltransferase
MGKQNEGTPSKTMPPPGHRSIPSDAGLVQLPPCWDSEAEIPAEVNRLLEGADALLQQYWDSWHRRPIEQYVACDFRDVYRAMSAIENQSLARGNLFCEWGCGFGIVTAMAAQLGWEAIGIEAESFLVERARKFLASHAIAAEIWQGNFLPSGSERLARHQANHASLFHQVPNAYEDQDLQLDDFAIVFAYPWPGEDGFLKDVFRVYASDSALLLLFLGPYELELYRKVCS